jgi:hypothetical protein
MNCWIWYQEQQLSDWYQGRWWVYDFTHDLQSTLCIPSHSFSTKELLNIFWTICHASTLTLPGYIVYTKPWWCSGQKWDILGPCSLCFSNPGSTSEGWIKNHTPKGKLYQNTTKSLNIMIAYKGLKIDSKNISVVEQ